MYIYFTVDVPDYCQANPQDIIPDLENCAHFYNCSDVIHMKRVASMECTYPDLFSRVTLRCERFTTVTCDKRPEPQAPCMHFYKLFHIVSYSHTSIYFKGNYLYIKCIKEFKKLH